MALIGAKDNRVNTLYTKNRPLFPEAAWRSYLIFCLPWIYGLRRRRCAPRPASGWSARISSSPISRIQNVSGSATLIMGNKLAHLA